MQIETLGDAFTYGVRFTMACAHGKRDGMKTIPECKFRLDLSTETLVATRGRDFPCAHLAERLRCPRCGSRKVRLMWNYPTNTNRGSAALR